MLSPSVLVRLFSRMILITAALAEEETSPPAPQPLKLQPRPGDAPAPARELHAGRGWLRVLPGGSAPSALCSAAAAWRPPGGSSAGPRARRGTRQVGRCRASCTCAGPSRQLDLFAWRPKPRPPVQLSLLGDLPDGAE